MQVVDIFMISNDFLQLWLVSKHFVSMQDHMKILYYTNHAGGSLSSEKWQEGQGEKRPHRLVAIASLLRDFSPLRLVIITLALTPPRYTCHVKYASFDEISEISSRLCLTKCS